MRLKISHSLYLFGAIIVIGIAAAATFGGMIVNQVRVGGPLYAQISQGKDLVADILPPPAYVIEAYLEANLAVQAIKPLAATTERLQALRKEYNERIAYWRKSDLPDTIKSKLVEKSHPNAESFWRVFEGELLPALAASDKAKAQEAYKKLTAAYETHRAAIDDVVVDANKLNASFESAAETQLHSTLIWVVGILGALLLTVLIGVLLLNGFAIKPLRTLVGLLQRMAQGEDVEITGTERRDEIGDIASAVNGIKVMLAEKARQEAEERIKQDKRTAADREAAEQRMAAEFEAAVGGLVRAAVAGDFSQRVDLAGKAGLVRNVGASLNSLCENVSKALNDLIEMLDALAGGDLTQRISAQYEGNFALLKDNANKTAERIGATIADIRTSAAEVSSASIEISAATTDLSQRTEEQAASLEQTTTSMEEISATVRKNAENAQIANQSAADTRNVATRGGQVVADAVAAMVKIEESSRKIADIIGVIDEIARQTNLLALNAAVEAARAGDAGRGFAVVASEVRSLAQRSSQAAKDITALITDSTGQVKEGVELVNKAGASLDEIVESIKKVAGVVADIAAASAKQSSSVDQINKALSQMDEMTQQNSALVEENAATAKTLEQQAKTMDERVTFFRVADDTKKASARAAVRTSKPASQTRSEPAPKRQAGHAAGQRLQVSGNAALKKDSGWQEF